MRNCAASIRGAASVVAVSAPKSGCFTQARTRCREGRLSPNEARRRNPIKKGSTCGQRRRRGRFRYRVEGIRHDLAAYFFRR
jgi:hypothetical protein